MTNQKSCDKSGELSCLFLVAICHYFQERHIIMLCLVPFVILQKSHALASQFNLQNKPRKLFTRPAKFPQLSSCQDGCGNLGTSCPKKTGQSVNNLSCAPVPKAPEICSDESDVRKGERSVITIHRESLRSNLL